jgi:hypothetical protein
VLYGTPDIAFTPTSGAAPRYYPSSNSAGDYYFQNLTVSCGARGCLNSFGYYDLVANSITLQGGGYGEFNGGNYVFATVPNNITLQSGAYWYCNYTTYFQQLGGITLQPAAQFILDGDGGGA